MRRNFNKMLSNFVFKPDNSKVPTNANVGLFNDLPPEIILYLVSFLNCKDQITMSLVNPYFTLFANEQLKKNNHFETMNFFKLKKYIFKNGVLKLNPEYKTSPEFQTCGCQRK